jgi:hypothetical protein
MRKLVAGVFAVCGLSLIAGPAGATTGIPTVRATPSRGLMNGSTVTVTWHHFRSGDRAIPQLSFVECSRNLTVQNADGPYIDIRCDMSTLVPVFITHSGTIQMSVVTGTIDTSGDTCGTSAADIHGCEIAAYERDGAGTLRTGQFAIAPISFALPT